MQYLTLLAAFTTLLSLTAGSPIAAGPPPAKPKGISSGYGYLFLHPDTFVLHNNKDNACTLEFKNVWGCKDTVVVDSKHTCNTLPKNAHLAGKAGNSKDILIKLGFYTPGEKYHLPLLTMQLITLLSSLSVFLTLTVANPVALPPGISPQAKPEKGITVFELKPIDNSCHLKIHGYGCKRMALVAKNKKCYELPSEKLYQGKTCGKGKWKVDTHNPIGISFDSGKGTRVSCNLYAKGGMSC
ncbi:MAG: hypothetical protein Q9168_005741 [Polycauliona sp. 1 TL-2023]